MTSAIQVLLERFTFVTICELESMIKFIVISSCIIMSTPWFARLCHAPAVPDKRPAAPHGPKTFTEVKQLET